MTPTPPPSGGFEPRPTLDGRSDTVSVLAVHGNGGGGFRFARAALHFPPEVRFHAVTLPGFADEPADPSLRTLADFADRLAAELAELPAPRVALGHGIGGSLLLELIARLSVPADPADPGAAGTAAAGRRVPAERLAGVILHAPVGAHLGRRLFPRLMALPGMRWLGRQVFAAPPARPLLSRLLFRAQVPRDYRRRFFTEYRRCRAFSQMFDLITEEWFEGLEPVEVPARLLWGGRERVLSSSHVAEFERLLPRAETRIVDDWDHFPMIDAPQEYAATVAALARELAPGDGTDRACGPVEASA